MFRAFRKWLRTRRQNQVEQDQETSSSDTGSGAGDFEAEAASASSSASEQSLSNHGNPFLPEEGGPFQIYEDPEVERSGPEFVSTPLPGLRPALRERDLQVSSVSPSFLLLCFQTSQQGRLRLILEGTGTLSD